MGQLVLDILMSNNESSSSTVGTSPRAMRSQATEKFTRLHPDSHSTFRAMMASAQMTREDQQEDYEDQELATTPEITNMLKNKILTQFRADDDIEEVLRRNRKMITKKLSWSQNLIQVQILFDWHYSLSIENLNLSG